MSIGFLSRIQPAKIEELPLFRSRHGWHNGIKVQLTNPRGGLPWKIYGAHFWNNDLISKNVLGIACTELARLNPRTHQASRILMEMREDPGPSILIGDLNTFPFSKAYNLLRTCLIDSCPIHKTFKGTYRHAGIKPRLDYILHTPDLTSCDYHVLATSFSDHASVVARLA